jgi:GTP cyclohydrolase II
VFQRASSAAIEDATPTFRSKVKRRSRTAVAVSIVGLRGLLANASQSQAGCKVFRDVKCSVAYLLYCSFAMTPKRNPDRRTKKKGRSVKLIAQAALPTRYGRFTIYGFKGRGPLDEAIALVRGKLNGKSAPLVRVHSQCLTGDVLGSLRCDCRAQLELSLRKIGQVGAGVLLYLPQEGRGIGLMNKIRAYQLQDGGMDTVEANETLGFAADARDYDFSAHILKKLGATKIRLLSNNPEKVRQLEESGIRVVQRVPCQPRISTISRAYLQTKKSKMGHILEGL